MLKLWPSKFLTVCFIAFCQTLNVFGDGSVWPTTLHPGMKFDSIPVMGSVSTMGLAFLSTGEMILVTCQTSGSPNGTDYGGGGTPPQNADAAVWIVENKAGVLSKPRKITDMLRQPTGVAIGPNDEIMVPDRDSIYKIPSLNPTNPSTNKIGVLPLPVMNDWHHWVFTPIYYAGNYLAPYSGSMVQGGYNTTDPTSDFSGAMLSWNSIGSGGFKKYAGGLRSPNGAALGPNGVILMSDNQGSYEPSCPINIVKPNVFYGYKQEGKYKPNWAEVANKANNLPYQPPVAWMIFGTLGKSTSQPMYMSKGPYAGDWIVGDVNAQGFSRITLDPVNGGTGATADYNSSVTYFTGGLGDAAPNRLIMDPNNGTIYIGTLGVTGNWPRSIPQSFFKLTFTDSVVTKTFEILSVKSRDKGVEIIFSQPLDTATAVLGSFKLSQMQMNRQDGYGWGNDGIQPPNISSIQVSDDRKRVFLNVGNVAGIDKVLEITGDGIRSAAGNKPLLFSKTWLTHNYQSTVAFNASSTTALSKNYNEMNDKISHAIFHNSVNVRINLTGRYTVSLCGLNGVELAKKTSDNASTFNFKAPSQGLYILRVDHGSLSFAKPIAF